MRKTVLYIASSLDGFIADPAGNIDWLLVFDAKYSSYAAFIDTVDTIIMGHTTYMQLITQLSPNIWPYEGKEVYVASRQSHAGDAGITFVQDPVKLVEELKSKAGKTIWIVGGAKLITSLLEADLIDTLILTLAPLTIGQGIALFPRQSVHFELTDVRAYPPFAELTYKIDKIRKEAKNEALG